MITQGINIPVAGSRSKWQQRQGVECSPFSSFFLLQLKTLLLLYAEFCFLFLLLSLYTPKAGNEYLTPWVLQFMQSSLLLQHLFLVCLCYLPSFLLCLLHLLRLCFLGSGQPALPFMCATQGRENRTHSFDRCLCSSFRRSFWIAARSKAMASFRITPRSMAS